MRDYNGVPERDPNPPTKIYQVPVCPECGDDELGENFKAFRMIDEWLDGEPYKYDGLEPNGDPLSPRFYCCNCGDEFDEFLVVEREF